MQQKTKAIVLRTTKYGETSLICTLFTELYGIQSYLLKGVRSVGVKSKTNRAGLLQVGSQLDIVVEHKPNKSLQTIKEFGTAYYYQQVQEQVVANTVALYAIELLLRLLPEASIQTDLFDFTEQFLQTLDATPPAEMGNYPIYFTLSCAAYLGYAIQGVYSENTPYLSITDATFTASATGDSTVLKTDALMLLSAIMQCASIKELTLVKSNSQTRKEVLDWLLLFLKQHTEHMHTMKSLAIIHSILH